MQSNRLWISLCRSKKTNGISCKLFAQPRLFSSCKAFAQLDNLISCKEQQRADGERVRKNERESVREREKRVENERIQKLEKRVLNSEGEFLTCSQSLSLSLLYKKQLKTIIGLSKILPFFVYKLKFYQ